MGRGAGAQPLSLCWLVSQSRSFVFAERLTGKHEGVEQGWLTCTRKYAAGCTRNVSGGGYRVRFRETHQEATPWPRRKARNLDPGTSG